MSLLPVAQFLFLNSYFVESHSVVNAIIVQSTGDPHSSLVTGGFG